MTLFGISGMFRRIVVASLSISFATTLSILGCTPPPAVKKPRPTETEGPSPAAPSRVQRNLQNVIDVLQPDKLGLASGPEQAIAALNEWARGARQEAEANGEPWTPDTPHELLKSMPKSWLEQFSLDQFVTRDSLFLRDALWASQATKFAAGDAEKDLDIVVNLFDHVVRNIALIPGGQRDIPLGPFDVIVLGRGTAHDRAWVFAELLRQRNIDSVILTPSRRTADAGTNPGFLVGVLFEKDILLFDPHLGVPLPADATNPRSPLPRLPLTTRRAQSDATTLAAITEQSHGEFSWTTELFQSPKVELICHSEQLSSRMRRLQRDLAGEQSIVVSDPLEDHEDQPGLFSRVANHPAATWSAKDIGIWNYPETVREAAVQMSSEQLKKLARLSLSLNAPQPISAVEIDEDQKKFDLEFAKPARTLMKLRILHVTGKWSDAIPGFLAVQLYDVDPPTTKDLAAVRTAEKRYLRSIMMMPKYADVRRLHLLAVDDACFWLAQCQYEQKRLPAVLSQCDVYARQHPNGAWAIENQWLKAITLAGQQQFSKAIAALAEAEGDHPAVGNHRLLTARWKRLLDATK